MRKWSMDGWTRRGKLLSNADLWQVMQRALMAMEEAGLNVEFRHVPAHVGIVDNEKADKLAKASMRWAHKNTPRTHHDSLEPELDRIGDEIVTVTACCNTHNQT